MSGCRIGKVTLKSGGELHLLPKQEDNRAVLYLDFGEVVLRTYDGEPISYETAIFMLRVAEYELLKDEDDD